MDEILGGDVCDVTPGVLEFPHDPTGPFLVPARFVNAGELNVRLELNGEPIRARPVARTTRAAVPPGRSPVDSTRARVPTVA